MLVNFIFILFLLISFFSFGLFFKRYFFISKFSYENSFFHIVFYGIFFLTAISVTFNFFLPLHNIILYIIIFIVLVLSLFSFKNLIKKDLNKILFISIVLSPLSVFMDFGYDSGLYHIPYQVVIQND